jgi:uncharacterized protein (TIGR02594 family)
VSRWDYEYRNLPTQTRAAVDELVDAIFRAQTGFTGKIDPSVQPQSATRWIEIRDQVLANRQQFAQWLQQTVSGLAGFAQAITTFEALDREPPWIRVVRREIGTHEIPGPQHNPRIMEYIRTCTNIQQTAAQRRYVEREGEEGVEWCSAFVNWCLRQVNIVGTNHALASSWVNWGIPLTEPKQGAIVCFSWSGGNYINHVAFCDEINDQFQMLGGNQTGLGGQVSAVAFSRSKAKHYRWPGNA